MSEAHTTTHSSTAGGVSCYTDYIRTIPGILKIVEIVLDLIVIICAAVGYFYGGYGWIEFTAITALICSIIILVFYLLGFVSRVSVWLLFEFIYLLIILVFWVISVIIAIVGAARWAHGGRISTTIFSILALIAYAIDFYFALKAWRSGTMTVVTSSGGTTTTTKTTTVTVG